MFLTPENITALASSAGFQGNDLVTAVAVALAESGGKTDAYNPEVAAAGGTPGGKGSQGLWQIYVKVHPEFGGLNLNDPQINAQAAFQVYQAAGRSFRPWSAFKTGVFAQYMPVAASAVNSMLQIPNQAEDKAQAGSSALP